MYFTVFKSVYSCGTNLIQKLTFKVDQYSVLNGLNYDISAVK